MRGLTSVEYGGSALTIMTNGILTGSCVFKLFEAATYTGSLSFILPDITALGLDWDTSYLSVDGTLRATNGVTVTPVINNVTRNPNGSIQISGSGTLVAPFDVLASTDVALPISSWVNVGSGTFSNGAFTFTDLTATNYPQRFYLIRTPTP